VAGEAVAARMPLGYHRMGRVLLLRLPADLRRYGRTIGRAWQDALNVETVLAQSGPIEGELRRPRVELLAGTETSTEVIEYGVRYRFDAASVMFATGNRTERQRIASLVVPGETVVDLFAGIGYFVLPIARHARPQKLWAVEKNPVAFRYLLENLRLNSVTSDVEALLGDNRSVALPRHAADRVLLGYLPDSRPWVGRALELASDRGAWLHVHIVHDVRPGPETAARAVERAVLSEGGELLRPATAREVKPYGPGRSHVVVDLSARPARR
jgi:tRNA wybutosine-synthesizing protein 2